MPGTSGLNKYRKIHTGPVALVAPGPSIKPQLNLLNKLPPERVIAVNTGINAVPHAEYAVSQDRQVLQEIAKRANVLFAIDKASSRGSKKETVVFKGLGPWELDYSYLNPNYGYRPKRFRKSEAHQGELKWGFSLDLTKGMYSGRTSTYAAIMMALWMGFTEIYLFGVDLGYEGKDSHFYGSKEWYKTANVEEWFKLTGNAISCLAPHLYELRVRMYNCSPASRLKTYPYVEYEEACRRICSG